MRHFQRRREQLLNWALLVTPSGQSLPPFRYLVPLVAVLSEPLSHRLLSFVILGIIPAIAVRAGGWVLFWALRSASCGCHVPDLRASRLQLWRPHSESPPKPSMKKASWFNDATHGSALCARMVDGPLTGLGIGVKLTGQSTTFGIALDDASLRWGRRRGF